MKTKDILLFGLLAGAGYLLYKHFTGGGIDYLTGGAGGGAPAIPLGMVTPAITEGGTDVNTGFAGTQTIETTQIKPVYFLEYGKTPAPLSQKIIVPAKEYKYNPRLIVPVTPKGSPAFQQVIRKIFPPVLKPQE